MISTSTPVIGKERNVSARETRQYSMNRKQTVAKKLKDLHITDIKFDWKSEQCCIIDMHMVYFELCTGALERRFPEYASNKWTIVNEQTGKSPETKLLVSYNGKTLVHLSVYKTKNRLMVHGNHVLEFMDTDFPCLVQHVQQNKDEAEQYWSSRITKETARNVNDHNASITDIEGDAGDLPASISDPINTSGVNSSRRKRSANTTPRAFSLKGMFKGSPNNADTNMQSLSMQNQMLDNKVIKLEETIDTYVQELKSTLFKQVEELSNGNIKLLIENAALRRVDTFEKKNVNQVNN
jgi:hypothetical protein